MSKRIPVLGAVLFTTAFLVAGCKEEVKIGGMTEAETIKMLETMPNIKPEEREQAIKNARESFRKKAEAK